jgi:branched-chain amino acid transport system permease protein
VIGAVLLGSLEQFITVTISSSINLLLVGLLLVGFVIIAPNGLIGLWQRVFSKRHSKRKPQGGRP